MRPAINVLLHPCLSMEVLSWLLQIHHSRAGRVARLQVAFVLKFKMLLDLLPECSGQNGRQQLSEQQHAGRVSGRSD